MCAFVFVFVCVCVNRLPKAMVHAIMAKVSRWGQGVKVVSFTAPETNRILIRKPQSIRWLHETRKGMQQQSLRHAAIKGIDEASIARPIARPTGTP